MEDASALDFIGGGGRLKRMYTTETGSQFLIDGSSLDLMPVENSDMMIKRNGIIRRHNGFNCYECDITALDLVRPRISETGQGAVAGLLKHAAALTMLMVPFPSDYDRFIPDCEAPVNIAWGYFNRSTVVRIPYFSMSKEARVEFRSPAPRGDPYLKMVAVHAAMMDCIENSFDPQFPLTENAYRLGEDEKRRLGITDIPTSIGAARKLYLKDGVLVNILGSNPKRIANTREFAEDYFSTQSIKLMVGVEPEFFLLRSGDLIDYEDYCSPLVHPCLLDLWGEGITRVHHETAKSQFEIGFDFSEAIETADKILTYMALIKKKAASSGLSADFRAKPFEGMNGSGMHMHLSLWKNNRNLFA